MGAISASVTTTGAFAKTQVSIQVDSKTIQAVGAACQSDSIPASDSFTQIILTDGNDNIKSIGTTLASGYIGTGNPIGWDGSIKTDHSSFVVLTVQGSTAATFRLTVITE